MIKISLLLRITIYLSIVSGFFSALLFKDIFGLILTFTISLTYFMTNLIHHFQFIEMHDEVKEDLKKIRSKK